VTHDLLQVSSTVIPGIQILEQSACRIGAIRMRPCLSSDCLAVARATRDFVDDIRRVHNTLGTMVMVPEL
jgi:hypothetical protein